MSEVIINPYKCGLDHANAHTMALLSNLVYIKRSDIDQHPDEGKILAKLKKTRCPDFISVKGFDKNSAQAMCVTHKLFKAIVFRGTNEPNDWLDNLNAFPEKVLFGSFHRGFYRSVADLWPSIQEHMQEIEGQHGKLPLFITGHSLGGAMASIAASELIHRDLPFISVYTFGQPRAMDRETSRIFNIEAKERYFRFQNNEDIVTRVPARVMGYSHVGQCLYIDQDKEIHTDPGFWFKFIDTMGGALDSILKVGSVLGISDHDMGDYLAAVKEWNCSSG